MRPWTELEGFFCLENNFNLFKQFSILFLPFNKLFLLFNKKSLKFCATASYKTLRPKVFDSNLNFERLNFSMINTPDNIRARHFTRTACEEHGVCTVRYICVAFCGRHVRGRHMSRTL